MLHHEHGVGLDETQRQDRVGEHLVEFFGVAWFCHADVVSLQVTVHGEGQEHDIKQPTFDGREVKVVKAAPHLSNVRGAHHAFLGQGSTDGREGFDGRSVQFVDDVGRVLVDPFHQQQKMFGKRGQHFRDLGAVNGLERLASSGDNRRSQVGFHRGRRHVADEQSDVRVGQRQHAVRSKDRRQPMDVQGFQHQHDGEAATFVPHRSSLVAQTLGGLQTEGPHQFFGSEDVEEGLLVNGVHEAHQPVVGPLTVQGDHERKQFGHVGVRIQTALVQYVHRFVFLALTQQGVESPPCQTIPTLVNVRSLQKTEPLVELFGGASLGLGGCVLPCEGATGRGERILSVEGHDVVPIFHGALRDTVERFERAGEFLVGLLAGFQGLAGDLMVAVEGEDDGDESHGVGEVVKRRFQVEFPSPGDLVGGFLQGDLDVGVVHARTGQFQNGQDLVLVARVNPEEVRADFAGGFRLGDLCFGKGKELAEQWRFFSDGVPHGMNAFNHAGFTKQVFVGVPCFVPMVSIHLFVNEERGELVSGRVGGRIDDVLRRVKPRHVGGPGGRSARPAHSPARPIHGGAPWRGVVLVVRGGRFLLVRSDDQVGPKGFVEHFPCRFTVHDGNPYSTRLGF